MKKNIPAPPDARQEPGHSRESVELDPPTRPPAVSRGGAVPPATGAQAQADGYSDTVKNPPGSQQGRR